MIENKTVLSPFSKYLTHTVTREPLLGEQLHLSQMLLGFKQCACFGKNTALELLRRDIQTHRDVPV